MGRHSKNKQLAAARLIVVMGVSGSGKTKVGTAVAARLDVPFLDGDEYHPPENIAKMSNSIPLTDADRWSWLDRLGRAMRARADAAGMAVSACSALRRTYRERLILAAGEPILFVQLEGARDEIARRMAARTDHYMPTALLDSQFATLEPPADDENAMVLGIVQPVSVLTDAVVAEIKTLQAAIEKGKS